MTLKLDENQQKAVEHFEGPALVVAGPGSGKTTVIKKRILHLISEHKVDPEHILAIAFTNAAVEEMVERIQSEQILNHKQPEICTLHVFGKGIITKFYELLGFTQEPNIWNADDVEQNIYKEKARLKTENSERLVTIYKCKGSKTGRCYIGQTINLARREREHREHSSNRGLRDALKKGDEHFDFKLISKVKGQYANRVEENQINFHKNLSVVNLALGTEHIVIEYPDTPVTIYKIKLPTVVTCWIGISTDTDPERIKNEAFHRAIEDESIKSYPKSVKEELHKAVEDESIKSAAFEIVGTVSAVNAARRVKQEIEKHKKWAVFNRQSPLQASESNRRQIEVFCEYFDIPYAEVIEQNQKFKDLMEKFDSLKDDIEKEKRQVDKRKSLFKPDRIQDPILQALARRYEEKKRQANAIDFVDMLIYSAYLLEINPSILCEYRDTYRYVLVDEFQDISPIDFRLISLFLDNLFAVGDDDQAIYGFRGGDSQIMQDKFGKQANVANYEITRNYRSTSSVVKHARSLILYNNPHRFSKNLRAENSAQSRVEVLETSRDTIENTLLNELFPIVTTCETHFKENMPDLDNPLLQELTAPQKIGILARNWYEVNPIQTNLNSILKNKGFQVPWSDSDDQEKRKLIMRRGKKEIELSTIHSAKGREWEKVILLVNTMTYSRKTTLPDERNDLEDERRLFYVAVTRAKQELVVLGGNCQFISEFQNVRPIEILETIESQLKKELENISRQVLENFKSKLKQELEEGIAAVLKQSDELSHLRVNIAKDKKASKQVQMDLSPQLKSINGAFLEDLIPVLDAFEAQINSAPATVKLNNKCDGFVEFTKNVRFAEEQLLDSLKNYGLKPIDTSCGAVFNPVHHEELLPAIYSNEAPIGRIVREEQRGYLLHDSVVRKAQVILSKGQHRADALLCQDFAQPVRFATYTGFRDLRNIETFNGEVKGYDSQGKVVPLQNLNVLFAFSKGDMTALRLHIKRRRVIVDRNLQPVKQVSKRYHISDDALKSLIVKRDAVESENQASIVQLVTRSGHVLSGLLWDFDEDFLYLNINKKVVIVYRAGILQFKQIWDEIAEANQKGTPIDGYVTKRVKDGLQVRFGLLHGFLPESQVEIKTVRNLGWYVGKILKMKVTKLSKPNNDIVFSRGALLEEERTKLFNAFREGPEEPIRVRNIERMPKTVEPIPGPNDSTLVPKAECIRLNEPISVIVPEPVEEVIDTSPPISTDLTESLDTYVKDLKPEPREIVEVQGDPLYEPIDLIDSRLPTPENSSRGPNLQTQDLTPVPPPIEIDPDLLETVNSDADSTLPGYEDFIIEQIRAINPETLEPDITSYPPIALDNRAQETPQGHEDILREQVQDLRPDIAAPENPGSEKKSFGDYLSQSGRFVVEKIKAIIFRKSSS